MINRTIRLLQHGPEEYVKLVSRLRGKMRTSENTNDRRIFPFAWSKGYSKNSRFLCGIFEHPLFLWGPAILFIEASDEDRLPTELADELPWMWENNYVHDHEIYYFNERLGCEDPFARCLVDFMHFAINRIIIHHGYMKIVFKLLDELEGKLLIGEDAIVAGAWVWLGLNALMCSSGCPQIFDVEPQYQKEMRAWLRSGPEDGLWLSFVRRVAKSLQCVVDDLSAKADAEADAEKQIQTESRVKLLESEGRHRWVIDNKEQPFLPKGILVEMSHILARHSAGEWIPHSPFTDILECKLDSSYLNNMRRNYCYRLRKYGLPVDFSKNNGIRIVLNPHVKS